MSESTDVAADRLRAETIVSNRSATQDIEAIERVGRVLVDILAVTAASQQTTPTTSAMAIIQSMVSANFSAVEVTSKFFDD